MPTICKCQYGKTGRRMSAPLDMPSGKGMCFRSMIGGGSGNALLGVAPEARPPFLGKEQLDTQGFYSLGKGTRGLPAPPSLDNLASKLSKIKINTKPLKKNIKINF